MPSAVCGRRHKMDVLSGATRISARRRVRRLRRHSHCAGRRCGLSVLMSAGCARETTSSRRSSWSWRRRPEAVRRASRPESGSPSTDNGQPGGTYTSLRTTIRRATCRARSCRSAVLTPRAASGRVSIVGTARATRMSRASLLITGLRGARDPLRRVLWTACLDSRSATRAARRRGVEDGVAGDLRSSRSDDLAPPERDGRASGTEGGVIRPDAAADARSSMTAARADDRLGPTRSCLQDNGCCDSMCCENRDGVPTAAVSPPLVDVNGTGRAAKHRRVQGRQGGFDPSHCICRTRRAATTAVRGRLQRQRALMHGQLCPAADPAVCDTLGPARTERQKLFPSRRLRGQRLCVHRLDDASQYGHCVCTRLPHTLGSFSCAGDPVYTMVVAPARHRRVPARHRARRPPVSCQTRTARSCVAPAAIWDGQGYEGCIDITSVATTSTIAAQRTCTKSSGTSL